MRASSLTSFLNVKAGKYKELESVLKSIGNPIKDRSHQTKLQFGDKTHFARLVILPGLDSNTTFPGQDAQFETSLSYRLMVNAVFDGSTKTFVDELISNSDDLDAVFSLCEGYTGVNNLHQYLTDPNHLRVSQIFYDTFIGESVATIKAKAENRKNIQKLLDKNSKQAVKEAINNGTIKPVKDNPPVDSKTPAIILLAVAVLVVVGITYMLWNITIWAVIIEIAILFFIVGVPVFQIVNAPNTKIGVMGGIKDQVKVANSNDGGGKPYYVDMVSGREDVLVQNQFNLYLTFKGNWIQKLVGQLRMRALLFILGQLTEIGVTPGSLGGLSTVHFGHWVMIDGGRRLFFITNYDGAWETYISDFVNKIFPLLDVQLQNFVGFSTEGTRDIASFRLWLRNVQIQSGVFYSAYPELTVRNITRDRAINANFPAPNASDQTINRWLELFGSPQLIQPLTNSADKKINLPTIAPHLTKQDWNDIQSFIVYGYARFPYGKYLFLKVEDVAKAKEWLSKVASLITTVQAWDSDQQVHPHELDTAINIAINHKGLKILGLHDKTLKSFPESFQEGIAPEPKGNDKLHPRSILLGDTEESAPFKWSINNPNKDDTQFHILLIFSGKTQEAVDALINASPFSDIASGNAGVKLTTTQQGSVPTTGREPFGFRDGISNPWIEGTRYVSRDTNRKHGVPLKLGDKQIVKKGLDGDLDRIWNLKHTPVVRTGEFILGYPNQYGQLPQTPLVWNDTTGLLKPINDPDQDSSHNDIRDFGRNGSYLVYRKLQQDVQGFWDFVRQHSGEKDGQPDRQHMEYIASKMVGRWPSGVPMSLAETSEKDREIRDKASAERNVSILNDFSYRTGDEIGTGCPFGSHLRRGNPRDAKMDDMLNESYRNVDQHRIMRRAVTFGKMSDHQVDRNYYDEHGAPVEITHTLAGEGAEDPDGVGIHFFGINANMQQQFEFIQQAWNNSGQFNGMYNNQDPITGNGQKESDPEKPMRYAAQNVTKAKLHTSDMIIAQADEIRQRFHDVPRFVHVKGGAYLFIPSITALQYLATV